MWRSCRSSRQVKRNEGEGYDQSGEENCSRRCGRGVAGAALLAAPIAALAAHGKAGLWQMTVTIDSSAAHMPDMSSLPPEAQARMKAMGIGMNGNSITMQHCMAATDFSTGKIPLSTGRNKNCTNSNVSFSGNRMTADVTCTGSFVGTGHFEADWDSDEHYTADISITGTRNGQPMTNHEKIEGRFLSAQCGATGQ
jgi:hypothetical protein